jgi:pyrroline-5-carboxylate reductase
MNICFVGGGNMATAMIGGMLKRGYSAKSIRVVEINAEARARLHEELGIRAVAAIHEGVEHSQVVVLAVKPQQLREVAQEIKAGLDGQLVISIAAGVRAQDLARWLGTQNIVRAMPNTPALVRSGMTGLYALPEVEAAQREHAQHILAAVGHTLWLQDEAMMDAVTAISGSGPAYVFYFIEAMQQAAQEMGFTLEEARRLTLDTFLGATKLADASTEEVSVLRARVTSKNGTTERALLAMAAAQVKDGIIAGAKAAAARSRELGDELGGD